MRALCPAYTEEILNLLQPVIDLDGKAKPVSSQALTPTPLCIFYSALMGTFEYQMWSFTGRLRHSLPLPAEPFKADFAFGTAILAVKSYRLALRY